MIHPPIQSLPEGYREARHVVLTDPSLLLRLNLYSLIPLIGALILTERWRLFARTIWGVPTDPAEVSWLIGSVAAIIGVLVLHEAVHGVVILLCGYRPRFGAKLAQGVLYATTDNAYFRRDAFLAVALAPLVVITPLGFFLIAVVSDALAYAVALAVAFNAAGAIGDLWSVSIIARYPRSALVRDEADGFRVYTLPG